MCKTLLWSNCYIYLNDKQIELMKEYEELDGNEAYEIVRRVNEDDLNILRQYASTAECGRILCYGKLGLWNGTAHGYKVYDTLEEIFYSDVEDIEWYLYDDELKATGMHHDGTNEYIYREITCDDEELDELVDVIYYHGNNEEKVKEYLEKYTKPMKSVLHNANII